MQYVWGEEGVSELGLPVPALQCPGPSLQADGPEVTPMTSPCPKGTGGAPPRGDQGHRV